MFTISLARQQSLLDNMLPGNMLDGRVRLVAGVSEIYCDFEADLQECNLKFDWTKEELWTVENQPTRWDVTYHTGTVIDSLVLRRGSFGFFCFTNMELLTPKT